MVTYSLGQLEVSWWLLIRWLLIQINGQFNGLIQINDQIQNGQLVVTYQVVTYSNQIFKSKVKFITYSNQWSNSKWSVGGYLSGGYLFKSNIRQVVTYSI